MKKKSTANVMSEMYYKQACNQFNTDKYIKLNKRKKKLSEMVVSYSLSGLNVVVFRTR